MRLRIPAYRRRALGESSLIDNDWAKNDRRIAKTMTSGHRRAGLSTSLVSNLLELFCVVCMAMSNPPHPQMSQSAGDIRYTHERLGHGVHLLRLSSTDLIIDTGAWRERRMFSFAEDFARQACRGSFNLAAAVRPSWPIVPAYARQYVFRCAPPDRRASSMR